MITKLLLLKLQPANALFAARKAINEQTAIALGSAPDFARKDLGACVFIGEWGMGMTVGVAGSEWRVWDFRLSSVFSVSSVVMKF